MNYMRYMSMLINDVFLRGRFALNKTADKTVQIIYI